MQNNFLQNKIKINKLKKNNNTNMIIDDAVILSIILLVVQNQMTSELNILFELQTFAISKLCYTKLSMSFIKIIDKLYQN